MSKRKLKELIDTQESGIKLLKRLVNDAEVPCELLPPGPERENALLYLQGSVENSHRSIVPVSEMWESKVALVMQMMG
ncbi:MAG: hypothetical protein LC794_13610 [Acidobacteria bacterium]|nr:hypothetical protein [Acidobacteriota bacterium]MCA1627709.1 hypothetical protein [Acidobacteriota bacterium]